VNPRLLFLLYAGVAWSARGATDPSANGPYAWAALTIAVPGTQGAALSTDVYYPAGTGGAVNAAATPCPVIVLGHGFSQSKARHVNQGRQLATRGYIVLIPSFNGFSDHARNAEDMRKCVDWITAQHAAPTSRFFGAVRTDAVGVSGHSAGGLSAILAAAADARIRAVSVMDPVDSGGAGVAALASVRVPVAMTWSERSSCNAFGSAEQLYAAARGSRRGLRIVGANHTDPQDPAGALSSITCGGAYAPRQALYRRYRVGWFEYFLRGDESYAPWVFHYAGGQVEADLAALRITDYHAVAPTRFAVAGDGAPSFFVLAPIGQGFNVEASSDGADWLALATHAASGWITNLPAVPLLWLRARSVE
jgi:dienelactone hydrolase